MRQKFWELWFLVSVVVFSAFFFVGTLEGSREMFPNFLWGLVPSIINLAICIYCGFKENER